MADSPPSGDGKIEGVRCLVLLASIDQSKVDVKIKQGLTIAPDWRFSDKRIAWKMKKK